MKGFSDLLKTFTGRMSIINVPNPYNSFSSNIVCKHLVEIDNIKCMCVTGYVSEGGPARTWSFYIRYNSEYIIDMDSERWSNAKVFEDMKYIFGFDITIGARY